ncbi:MAG: LacI family transcriptional regulator [Anaerolineaceae bacterium]|nr:LacI family transcriptional regulator [Anaerolineaceae bacterium]
MARKKASSGATIIDVAQEAGVSYSTVSRVVNNKSYVKPETRAKVLQAMTRLGYQANLQARSLAGGRSNVIGLLVVDLTTQYVGELIRGIDEVLTANQYELMLYTTHRRKTKESAYVNMMARGLADGLLIVLPRDPEAYLTSLRQREFPYVLIDQFGIDESDLTVTAANYDGGYAATRHLIELGHRRIGIITGWMDMVAARHRLDGYRAALAAHNIDYQENLVYEGDFTQSSGFHGANHLLNLAEPPTAIFASSDLVALGVMDAARSRNINIPADLSLIGFDDIPMSAVLIPQLTTVRQPLTDMGLCATQMLLALIQKPEEKQTSVILPTELIIRESTAPPFLETI